MSMGKDTSKSARTFSVGSKRAGVDVDAGGALVLAAALGSAAAAGAGAAGSDVAGPRAAQATA